MLKRLFFLFLYICLAINICMAQQQDAAVREKPAIPVTDSLLNKDSLFPALKDTVIDSVNTYAQNPLQRLLNENRFLNAESTATNFIQREKKRQSKDLLFYTVFSLVFVFALLKFIFSRYFSNLFRVFFNTSLRQSQLTDQLLQDKLPSLLFNVLFVLVGGAYIYLLLNYFEKSGNLQGWKLIMFCIATLAIIYLVKFMVLKFTGWVTGFKQEADTYIFIVFLVNKILAIYLIPLMIIVAFSDRQVVEIAMIISYVLIGVMLLLRFFRSYSLLRNRIHVSRLHFFLYIAGIEIIPLALIYKAALLFMSKNL